MKNKWSLLPIEIISDVVSVITEGCRNHDVDGWKRETADDQYDALMRHLVKLRNPDKYDKTLSYRHALSVICRAIFLAWHILHKK